MNRNATRRELRLMAALCCGVVIGAAAIILGYGYNSNNTATATELSPTNALSNRPMTAANESLPSHWVRDAQLADYSVIEKRLLFGATETETRSARVDAPAPAKTEVAIAKVDQQQPITPHDPEHDKVAVIGVVRISNETLAIVEDVVRGVTKFVPVGGEAFGYHVKSVSNEGAILSRDGHEYDVALGENKPEPGRPPARRGARADAVIQFEEAVIAEREAVAQKLNLYLGSVAATAGVEAAGISPQNADGILMKLPDEVSARTKLIWMSDK